MFLFFLSYRQVDMDRICKISLRKKNLDRWGILASLLCGIHCLMMPVAFPLLATLGMSWMDHWQTEWVILLTTIAIAEFSLLRSLLFEHGRILPSVLASLGFFLFALSFELYHSMSIWLRVLGGLALMSGHFLNMRLSPKNGLVLGLVKGGTLHWALLFVIFGSFSLWWSFEVASSHQLPATSEELLREVWQLRAASPSDISK